MLVISWYQCWLPTNSNSSLESAAKLVPCWHIRNRGCQSLPFDLYRPLVKVPATNQRIKRIRRHECPHCVYIASRMKREWLLRPTPSPPENRTSERPWKQLGGRSHYCASLTPASDLPRRDRADFPEVFQRPGRGSNASARGVREKRNGLVVTSRARSRYRVTVPRRVYDETFLEERGKCDVRDWPSAGPSASATRSATQPVTRGRGSSCKVTVTMRWFPSTAAVCCWLLVALGVGQVSTRKCSLREFPPLNSAVSNAPASAPEITRVCTRMCRQTTSRETCQELGSDSKFVV